MDTEMDIDDVKSNPISKHIRDRNRDQTQASRKFLRIEKQDFQRVGLDEIKTIIQSLENLTVKDVAGLTMRIKRRKGATEEDIHRLNCAFLQSVENILTFIKIPGGLNIVVKELIGNDAANQILACECLCNLALGDDFCCEKIAMSAGLYLIMNLKCTMNPKLQITCLWTIENLVATGDKALKILLFQKLITNLLALMDNSSVRSDVSDEAVKALNLLVQQAAKFFSCEELNAIVLTLSKLQHLNNVEAIQILFGVSQVLPFIDAGVATDFVRKCSLNIVFLHQKSEFKKEDFQIYLLTIRVIVNLCTLQQECLKCFLASVSNFRLTDLFHRVVEHNNLALIKEMLWFYAHLQNSDNEYVQNHLRNENFIQNLRVPVNIVELIN